MAHAPRLSGERCDIYPLHCSAGRRRGITHSAKRRGEAVSQRSESWGNRRTSISGGEAALPRCALKMPPLIRIEGRMVACHLYG
jgi:hypothetical protein